jgi:ABC-type enterochelin transport system substrate-binding protein
MRLLALVATLALTLAVGACGSDDDDGGDKGSNAADTTSTAATKPVAQDGTPEEQIRASYAAFVDGFYKKDAGTICSWMTEEAQQRFGKTFQKDSGKGAATCESQMTALINSAEDFSKNKPSIVKLKVNGKTAVIGAKTRNSDVYKVPFVKEGGVWKVSGGFSTL